ncbi:type II secretion system F family protein [Streptomyces sp. DSM 44917]|uniref:Type II secretion system F family protein n=1 Tax=Streptomyces boetiae TaxID=3075541 RepID=A0ABU2LAV4_9ACTN|nr:type II secretion system F family protein [Streptomyces sp. DSM 44917]MDT0308413.1 type II secretion system F family protein [Streptomyces sp. DSM 44917]
MSGSACLTFMALAVLTVGRTWRAWIICRRAASLEDPPGRPAGSGRSRTLRGRRLPRWRRAARAPADPELPLATELLAACLAAGAGPGAAAEAVGSSLGGPLGERLRRAATELRLGGDPAAVWGRLGEHPGAAGLARGLERAETSGVAVAAAVAALAAESRARRRRTAQARARRAGVLVTGPLGLCFLPAFLLIGVAPVVIGMAGALL